MLEADNNPEDPAAGKRLLPFSKVLYVEEDDFREVAPKKWFRLAPGTEVRLKFGYYVTCVSAVKDASGKVTELHCTFDPESRGGSTKDNRRVQGTLHWVSAEHAVRVEVRLFENLFTRPDPENVPDGQDFMANVNAHSLISLKDCLAEPSLGEAGPSGRYQFLRQGYFCADPDSTAAAPVFNRTVPLRDSWSKMEQKK
jgi:glutaminyl-tRNA synthetase